MKKSFTVLFALLFLTLPLSIVSTRASQNRFLMQIGVEDVDQDLAVLRSRYFHTYITVYEKGPMRIYVFYRDPYMRGDYFGGDSTFKKDEMAQFWGASLLTAPEQGARPWEWPLAVTGEFPNDRYSLSFLIGLNVTAKFSDVTVDVRLPDTLRRRWNVSWEFSPARATSDSLAALQIDYDRFKYEIEKCTDFYGLRVVFSRIEGEMERFNVYWYVMIALAAAITVVITLLSRKLSPKEIVPICLSLSGFAAQGLWSLQPYLPRPRVHWIERLYAIEIVGSIAWAVAIVFLKRHRKEENSISTRNESLRSRAFSPSPMHFGTELAYRLAKKEMRWLKQEKGVVNETDLISVANKYRFPIDFLKETMERELTTDEYVIGRSKWFPVLYAWAAQRKAARRTLMDAYIALGKTLFQFFMTTVVLVSVLAYLPLLYTLGIIEPVQLALAVIFPYVFFMIPFLYPLRKEIKEKEGELQDLIDQTRRSGYGYLADATQRFIMRYALALMLARFKTLEKDMPEITAYQIGEMPDGTPIAIAENPEQAYIERLRSLTDRPQ